MKRALVSTAALLLAAPAGAAGQQGSELTVDCAFSHRAPDDPIVHPKHPGDSHSHDFFGNRSTDSRSTATRLRRGRTNCDPRADRSAYWVPTLRSGGRAVKARGVRFYYVIVNADAGAVKAPPTGLRVIAGTYGERRNPGAPRHAWTCTETTAAHFAQIPLCPKGSRLVLRIRFPDCWDGSRLDSPDHQEHMAYHRDGLCPPSHPAAVPQLRFEIRYPIRGGSRVQLSSGPPWTTHGDTINAWDRGEFKRRLARCTFTGSCVEGPLGSGY